MVRGVLVSGWNGIWWMVWWVEIVSGWYGGWWVEIVGSDSGGPEQRIFYAIRGGVLL